MRALPTVLVALCLAGCGADGARESTNDTNEEAALTKQRARFASAFARPGASRFDVNGDGALVPEFDQAPSARVALPADAAAAVVVEDPRAGVAVAFQLENAAPAPAFVSSGFVVYSQPFGAIVHRVTEAGTEDLLLFDEKPPEERVRYSIDVRAAGLRLVGDALELLDARGYPRLHVAPPTITGADGKVWPAHLVVRGCAVDTNGTVPWRRAPIALGQSGSARCSLEVRWSGVVYPAALDPTWMSAHAMTVARTQHTATPLPGLPGEPTEVLVVGGFEAAPGFAASTAVEVYAPPPVDVFTVLTPLATARGGHTATLLDSGEVLLAGGADQLNGGHALGDAVLYAPVTGAGTAVSMQTARSQHTATKLADGRVLVAGGAASGANLAELFDPASASFVLPTGQMVKRRASHSATLLHDGAFAGQVLLVGGFAGGAALASAERFDPTQNTFTAVQAGLHTARGNMTANELPLGQVLVAGGSDAGATTFLASTEIYDSASDAFEPAASMTSARAGAASVALASGQIVIAGGLDAAGSAGLSSVDAFVPASAAFASFAQLSTPRYDFALTLLDEQILATGGQSGSPAVVLDSTEILGLSCSLPSDCTSGFCVSGVCCDEACDGACEACTGAQKTSGPDGACGPSKSGPFASDTSCESNVVAVLECDGLGGMKPATLTDCSPYVCVQTAGVFACGTTCSGPSDCAGRAFCDVQTHVCALADNLGTKCDKPEQCTSTFCVDGVCCSGSCTGPCEACDVSGNPGTCAPVIGAPHHQGITCPGDSDCASSCDGLDVLTCKYPTGRACGDTSCTGATATRNSCNDSGQCVPSKVDCMGFLCGAKDCLMSCTSAADCLPEHVCDESHQCVQVHADHCMDRSTLVHVDGSKETCSPHACDTTTNMCSDRCASIDDCAEGFVCDPLGSCVRLPANPAAASCTLQQAGSERRGGAGAIGLWIGLIGLAASRARWRRARLKG